MFPTTQRIARTLAGAAALTAALLGASSAQADTNPTLTPQPPDWYTCQTNGSGTICNGTMSFEHFSGYDGTCPQGFDILENGHTQETGHRYYDRNGFLVRRVLQDVYPVGDPLNVVYNSVTGTSLPYTAHVTESDTFGVPGDFSSITATITGSLYTINLPGQGLLVHDTGLITFSPDGEILQDHGPKMLFYGDTAKLCSGLS